VALLHHGYVELNKIFTRYENLYIAIAVARILSIGMIASIWPIYTMICCVAHWVSMTIWILINSHGILEFCRTYNHPPHMQPMFKERIKSVLFAMVIGVVHIFIFLNVIDDKTFWKHLYFYMLCCLENIALNLLWQFTASFEAKTAWYFNTFPIICLVSFLMGIVALIAYYTMFHPSKRQRVSNNTPLQA